MHLIIEQTDSTSTLTSDTMYSWMTWN